ncbi:MAG TPA: cupin domain-containing protein [Thermoanaerobaculia bacterium]|nr:cupin domain-containing protein [Thermoanaerobaculia bacterium]
MTRFTVERLLEPFSFSQFCDAYFEKQPLLIRRQLPAHYGDLLTFDALNAHLGQAAMLSTELRLVRNGEYLAESDFSWPDSSDNTRVADNAADKETLFARFYEGYSIVVSAYERHCASVLHLCHDMERVFHALAMTYVFLTPRNAQGFRAHRDEEDTFILQFAGTKHWTVSDGSGKPIISTTLEPGDFLYLPGGFVHEARSADTVSGHITLILERFTYADLLRQIADNAHASAWLRKSLPADVRSGKSNAAFLRHVHQFFDEADLPAYVERMHSDFAEDRLPDSTNRLADYVKLPTIGAASRFRRRSGFWPELKNGGEQVVLTFHRKELAFPVAAAQSLRVMIDGGEFVASALPGDGDENLALCSTLVREGFLTIVE